MLTNFTTIKIPLRLKLEKMEIDGTFENLTKKKLSEFKKKNQNLKISAVLKKMKELPGIISLSILIKKLLQ